MLAKFRETVALDDRYPDATALPREAYPRADR